MHEPLSWPKYWVKWPSMTPFSWMSCFMRSRIAPLVGGPVEAVLLDGADGAVGNVAHTIT